MCMFHIGNIAQFYYKKQITCLSEVKINWASYPLFAKPGNPVDGWANRSKYFIYVADSNI